MAAAVAIRAMDLVESDATLLARLRERIAQFRALCASHAIPVGPSQTAIHPIVVGAPERAVAMSRELAGRGFLVPAIRPPSVPAGTSRLRISLSAAHDARVVEALAQALAQCLRP